MSPRMVSALSRSFFDTQMVSSRILLAMAEFGWGVTLLWPGDTFGRPTYTLMAEGMAAVLEWVFALASNPRALALYWAEVVWGLVFLATSAVQFAIVAGEDFHGRLARRFAAFNAALWAGVVLSMYFSITPPPAAISGEAALALAALWIWLRPYVIYWGILYARRSTRV